MLGHYGSASKTPYKWCFASGPMMVSRVIVSRAYLHIILGRNPKFGVCMHLGIEECRVPFLDP